jgi:MFS family permease
MKEHYGGASTYGVVLGMLGAGMVLGGVIVLRWRPARPLLVSCLSALPFGLGAWMIAFLVPLPVLLVAQFLAGVGLAIHLALWFTVFQQQVPENARSRVSSYDALGSFVLIPLGTAAAGPVAAGIGIKETLILSGIITMVTNLIVVAQPVVWSIRQPEPTAA